MRYSLFYYFFLICLVYAQNPNPSEAAPPQDQTQGTVITSEELLQRQKQQQRLKQQQINKMKEDPRLRAQLEKEERQRAERTAKYKAQQQRIRILRKKQKQVQEKRKADMGIKQGEQIVYEETSPQVSETDLVKNRERKQLVQALRGFDNSKSGKSMMFEVNKRIQEFILNPSVDQEIRIMLKIYIEENNVFSFTKDVTKQQPLKLFIYEDNNRIVAQTSFFFESVVKFSAKGKSKYVLRFYNSGSLKLVTMGYTYVLQSKQADNIYDGTKSKIQLEKTKNLLSGVKQSISTLQQSQLIDFQNTKVLINSISKYFSYQIAQIVFVVAVCLVQVQFIKKMFKSVSIL